MAVNKKYKELIKKYISGRISEGEKQQLLTQAVENKEIAGLLKLHEQLTDPGLSFEQADEKSFKEMRLKVLNRINIIESKETGFFNLIKDSLLKLLYKPVFNLTLAAFMFFLGFMIHIPQEEFELVRSIYTSARQTTDLQSSIDAPYIYQNAVIEEQSNGQVRVSFDVSRHLEIVRSKNDPLIQDILAQSLINSNSVPQRLRSISNMDISMHPKIKQALITTMLNDSHPIVRQKSLFSLMKYKNDNDIQDALIRLLSGEESVYMRLAAIDYLSNNDVDLSLLEEYIINRGIRNNSAVNQKIRQLKYQTKEGEL